MALSSPTPRRGAATPAPRRPGRRLLGWAAGLLAAAVVSALAGLAIGVAVIWPQLPDVSALAHYEPKLPLRVYTADGALIGEFGEERRQMVPMADIPPLVKNAVLATEDARFYEHGAIDAKGVLRAVSAMLGGGRKQGASTITMQVARNMYLTPERTFRRKFQEVLLAYKLEHALSKDQILEIYLNQIYLGNRAYGFAAAADTYFGKPLSALTPAEAAMLAGLPKAPGTNNPLANVRRAVARQQYVIQRMRDAGVITPAQAAAAHLEPLHLRQADDPTRLHAEYVAEAVRQQIAAQYGEGAYTSGLQVYTTLLSNEQAAAYGALRQDLLDYEQRQPWRGPEEFVDLPDDPQALDDAVDEALSDHPDDGELAAAVVLQVDGQHLTAQRANGDRVQLGAAALRLAPGGAVKALSPQAPAALRLRRGAVIRLVKRAPEGWTLTQLPEVQGAFVALDPRDGAVRALVGGFSWNQSPFNRVTQAWRQPGSSFKPFIYSDALEHGFTPATLISNAPLVLQGADAGGTWMPKNFEEGSDAPVTLRHALNESMNLPALRVMQAIGPAEAQQWVTRFGFDAQRQPPYLSLALGAGTVTPMQLAAGYAVFANGGYRVAPRLIARVLDRRGQPLFEDQPPALDESQRAIPARDAFMVSTLLRTVVTEGTGRKAQDALRRADLYGKTGTTNDSFDAWFAGFQPTRVGVAWVGYDTPRQLGTRGETGASVALPVWIGYMRAALQGVPQAPLQPPGGVTQVDGEWYYDDFTPGRGIAALGVDGATSTNPDANAPANGPPNAPTNAPATSTGQAAPPEAGIPPAVGQRERNWILDLFRGSN